MNHETHWVLSHWDGWRTALMNLYAAFMPGNYYLQSKKKVLWKLWVIAEWFLKSLLSSLLLLYSCPFFLPFHLHCQDDITLNFDLFRRNNRQTPWSRTCILVNCHRPVDPVGRLTLTAASHFPFMNMVRFRANYLSVIWKFCLIPPPSHPSIPPVTSCTGDVYCDGAAILLRAESGGEVIARLAYGKPPSSIRLSLPFIIQLYLLPAAKLFIIKFTVSLGSMPFFLFAGWI